MANLLYAATEGAAHGATEHAAAAAGHGGHANPTTPGEIMQALIAHTYDHTVIQIPWHALRRESTSRSPG